MLISVIIEGMLSFSEDESAVVLREKEGQRRCLLTFHPVLLRKIQEAYHSALGKPQGHSLMVNVIAQMGGAIHHLVIPRLQGDRYEMILHIQHGHRDITQDMLASDALAFAACSHCPILMEEVLLEQANESAQKTLAYILQATNQVSVKAAENNALYLPEDKLPKA